MKNKQMVHGKLMIEKEYCSNRWIVECKLVILVNKVKEINHNKMIYERTRPFMRIAFIIIIFN